MGQGLGEVQWGWICALSTSGPGEARPGFMQISCEEAEDWLAWVGAGRAVGSGPTGARGGTGAVQARPLDHRPVLSQLLPGDASALGSAGPGLPATWLR